MGCRKAAGHLDHGGRVAEQLISSATLPAVLKALACLKAEVKRSRCASDLCEVSERLPRKKASTVISRRLEF